MGSYIWDDSVYGLSLSCTKQKQCNTVTRSIFVSLRCKSEEALVLSLDILYQLTTSIHIYINASDVGCPMTENPKEYLPPQPFTLGWEQIHFLKCNVHLQIQDNAECPGTK